MKALSKYPCTMKIKNQSNPYFSAYPLKIVSRNLEEKKNDHSDSKLTVESKKYADNINVLPMANPYSKEEEAKFLKKTITNSDPDSAQERENDWFASYE